ncbi:hypothetical protein CVT26_014524 [Gymnopilus dilepis]|uniref:Uncharacterized protein n=1 Tax=Gymnopilus dilepis TaxID=231916 RepID=A0A409W387_9AGAR|nr:hypothetical protein CVT26_014524 [Gymnopilus dilepis]
MIDIASQLINAFLTLIMSQADCHLVADFEVKGDLIWCTICEEGEITGEGKWISYQSAEGHLTSTTHISEVARKKKRKEAKEKQEERGWGIYGAPAAVVAGPSSIILCIKEQISREPEMPAEFPQNTSHSQSAFLDSEHVNFSITPISDHDPEAECE